MIDKKIYNEYVKKLNKIENKIQKENVMNKLNILVKKLFHTEFIAEKIILKLFRNELSTYLA